MTVAKKVELAVNDIPDGTVFTVRDLGFPTDYSANVKVKLNRMVRAGRLQKFTNGKYYKAKNTVFGQSLPATDELVKDLLYQDGKITGYLTGNTAWGAMQLTPQFSGNFTIGVNKRKAALTRGGQRITFSIQPNKITRENIHLLQILDALKSIKKIPDSSVSASIVRLGNMIQALPENDLKAMVKLALSYPPRLRALLGAILESNGYDELSVTLYRSLNHISEYKLGVKTDLGLNAHKWHIK